VFLRKDFVPWSLLIYNIVIGHTAYLLQSHDFGLIMLYIPLKLTGIQNSISLARGQNIAQFVYRNTCMNMYSSISVLKQTATTNILM
jgi:hypothetical protein